MRKIVFLDIDGTLRNMEGFIPESAISAVREARSNGHVVCLSSGRPYNQIDDQVLRIGFDGIISASGGYVTYQGKCIREEHFPEKDLCGLVAFMKQYDCTIEFLNHVGGYVLQDDVERYRKMICKAQEMLGDGAKQIEPAPSAVSSVRDLIDVEKILYLSETLSSEMILAQRPDLCIVEMSIPNAMRYSGEITLPSVNKAEGIKSILQVSGFRREDTIAFGDSENDASMLRYANVAVVMGNGTPAAKAEADLITDTVDEDGLMHAFGKLGLI